MGDLELIKSRLHLVCCWLLYVGPLIMLLGMANHVVAAVICTFIDMYGTYACMVESLPGQEERAALVAALQNVTGRQGLAAVQLVFVSPLHRNDDRESKMPFTRRSSWPGRLFVSSLSLRTLRFPGVTAARLAPPFRCASARKIVDVPLEDSAECVVCAAR